MRTRARTTSTALAAVALLAAFLGACGSDDDTATPSTSSTPKAQPKDAPAPATDNGKAELEQAVKDYTAAFFQPDTEKAYGMLSKRCQGERDKSIYAAQLEQAAADYGPQTATTVTVDQLEGNMARVTYEVSLPKFNQAAQPWTREGGAWKYDAC
ncbi:hypothetical protein AQ490_23270 [Wenjunlia vitaminophila]|uniref:Uncharacterized protein n=1 Tax=Wenjunlia vitaminophila TaxID=76728 RepID=A0A0T6LRP4_WENVI|nr:hypothetical protein [Wenjunlia vitaminophila]KRV48794.1 hypothetical protein AQ490_23270 [Wenjunlia vitaminophila]